MRLVTLSIILSVIAVILAFINVSIKHDKYLDYSNSKKNNTDDEEYDEDDDTIQKAIIILGDRKIEVEVDFYEIDYNIIKITNKYGEVYLTDIKNVLLTSEYRI